MTFDPMENDPALAALRSGVSTLREAALIEQPFNGLELESIRNEPSRIQIPVPAYNVRAAKFLATIDALSQQIAALRRETTSRIVVETKSVDADEIVNAVRRIVDGHQRTMIAAMKDVKGFVRP